MPIEKPPVTGISLVDDMESRIEAAQAALALAEGRRGRMSEYKNYSVNVHRPGLIKIEAIACNSNAPVVVADHVIDNDAATLIVHAVNSHNALVAALNQIAAIGGNLSDDVIESIGGVNEGRDRALKYSTARKIARAALALATLAEGKDAK